MTTRSPLWRAIRWIIGIALALTALLVMAAGALFVFAGHYDFGQFMAARLSAQLARKVTVGSLHITPGRWLHIELQDIQVANVPAGSKPVMAAIESAEADVEAVSVLYGPVVVRGLTIKGLNILLEHTPDGKKNWKFAGASQTAAPRTNDRTHYPTLLRADLTGEVLFRTSSGIPLDTRITQVRIETDASGKPIRLTGIGSYNDAPLTLRADLASFDDLRDESKPYHADIAITSGDSALHFVGTMSDPMNVDGAKGTLTLAAPTPAAVARIAGVSDIPDISLHLGGTFTHDDPAWHLSQASGTLSQNTITAADLTLTEGSAGKPDNVAVDLAFGRLDVSGLLATAGKAPGKSNDFPLTVDRAPDPLIEAKLSAGNLSYANLRATDVTLSGAVKPGEITLDSLSLRYLGAPIKAKGQLEALSGQGNLAGSHLTADAEITGMDAQALRKVLGTGNVPIAGRLDGNVVVESTAATLSQVPRSARLSALVTMNGGSIARNILEMASTDPLALFRKASGMSPMTCMIGIIDVRAGVGTISPLRIRSADGTITGRGTFDVFRQQLDLTVATDRNTTGVFALDVPMHVTGSFASPTIRPAFLSAAGRAQLDAADDVSRLLPELRPLARRSPCLTGRGN